MTRARAIHASVLVHGGGPKASDWSELDDQVHRAYAPEVVEDRTRRPFDAQWCREHFPRLNSDPPAKSHAQIISALAASAASGKSRRDVIAGYRGGGKTTISVTEYLCYQLCELRAPFIVFGAEVQKKAAADMGNVKTQLETNPALGSAYPEVCGRGKLWNVTESRTRAGQLLVAVGADSAGAHGILTDAHRPKVFAVNDPENALSVSSRAKREHRIEFAYGTMESIGGPETHGVYVGNVLHPRGLIATLLDDGTFDSRLRFPAVLAWSNSPRWQTFDRIAMDLSNSDPVAAALDYLEEHRDEMLDGTEVDWPERLGYPELMVIRVRMGTILFSAHYQAEPRSSESSPFQRFVRWDVDDPEEEMEALPILGEPMPVWVGIDPALGGNESRGSFCSMTALGRHPQGYLPVMHYRQGRWGTEKLIENAVAVARGQPEPTYMCPQPWAVQALCVETVGAFRFLAQDIEKALHSEGLDIPVIWIEQVGTGSKEQRVTSHEPKINGGIIRFGRGQDELVDGFRFWGDKDMPKDGPDSVDIALQGMARATVPEGRRTFARSSGRGSFGPKGWGEEVRQ